MKYLNEFVQSSKRILHSKSSERDCGGGRPRKVTSDYWEIAEIRWCAVARQGVRTNFSTLRHNNYGSLHE